MTRIVSISRLFILAVLLTGFSGAATAQVEQGQTEILGFIGGVSDGGGTTFGGGVQYAFGERIILAAEAAYLTGGEDFSGFGVDFDSSLLEFGGNVHYLFPMSNEAFTPYVLGGLGLLRVSASSSSGGFSSSASDTAIGLNIGGGARWQVGDNWGLRPELKIFIEDGSNVRFSIGFYRQFGG
ncbi:MAG: outer membrane beta-barrel protein [Acidobacteria bacterium]|nr:outer membrane beta-barrel protein [Acidobacteriota bacterium]